MWHKLLNCTVLLCEFALVVFYFLECFLFCIALCSVQSNVVRFFTTNVVKSCRVYVLQYWVWIEHTLYSERHQQGAECIWSFDWVHLSDLMTQQRFCLLFKQIQPHNPLCVYTTFNTLYIVHNTVYNVHYKAYVIHCIMYYSLYMAIRLSWWCAKHYVCI